jgi:Ca-activated chloride channel family protein
MSEARSTFSSAVNSIRAAFVVIIALLASSAFSQTVRITDKPAGLVSGTLFVPVSATAPVEKLALFINGVKWTETRGTQMNAQVQVGDYIRRLRMRAVGYDAQGNVAGEDEMVVNDPRPPFRVRLGAPVQLPESGLVTLNAGITTPEELRVAEVEFRVGEEKVGVATAAPFTATFDAEKFKGVSYARVVARASDGQEANDVFFFGDRARDQIDVSLQQLPLSIASGRPQLAVSDLTVLDEGEQRKIEALQPASDQPLHVILLIDYSESMLKELPVVKAAAKQFAKRLLRPQDRIAVVGFNQRTFWLTGFTNDWELAAQSVDRVKPIGETHLYDSTMEMIYELQKKPGRKALVVLTDGVDQGSHFKLEHLAHYARYAGVPIYPVVKNTMLGRLMRFGVGQLQARKLVALARDTGATYFIIKSESELPGVYQRIADELRQQYLLVFYSAPGVTDQWRALAISSRGGQQLRIPKGYFP